MRRPISKHLTLESKIAYNLVKNSMRLELTIMDKPKSTPIVIEGVTESGEIFRPSDWAERVSDNLSVFKNHRVYYSPLLRPSMKNNQKCLLLDKSLKESNPALYEHILEFARSNKLKICGENTEE